MHVTYDNEYRPFDFSVEKFVDDHCYKTLENVTLKNVGRHWLFGAKNVFDKMIKVKFNGGTLCNLFPRIDKLFPNATVLELIDLKICNPHDL